MASAETLPPRPPLLPPPPALEVALPHADTDGDSVAERREEALPPLPPVAVPSAVLLIEAVPVPLTLLHVLWLGVNEASREMEALPVPEGVPLPPSGEAEVLGEGVGPTEKL